MDMAAIRTSLESEAGFDGYQPAPISPRLVGQESSELGEPPIGQAACLPAGPLGSGANVYQTTPIISVRGWAQSTIGRQRTWPQSRRKQWTFPDKRWRCHLAERVPFA
jgi:hypothetical protein